MTAHLGSCHCGAVKFRVEADFKELRTCGCSLCRKRNALMVGAPVEALTVLEGEDRLTLYQWNARIARHHFCSVCGIYIYNRRRSAPDMVSINVQCLDDFNTTGLPVVAAGGEAFTVVAESPRDGWMGPRA